MTTPYDVYVNMLNKQAVDALVPGHIGMGINSGHADSDGTEATSSALARNRADMQAMALISGSADGGAGYSSPPPATSPSLQMQADVKAAAVIDEAIKFAEYIYMQTKQAAAPTPEQITAMKDSWGHADLNSKGLLAQGADLAWHRRSAVGKAGAVGAGLAAAGGLGYMAMQPSAAPMEVPQEALKTAHAVLEALGLQAMPKQAGMADSIAAKMGYKKMMTMGQHVDKATAATMAAAQRLAANPVAQAFAVGGTGAALGAGAMHAYKEAGYGMDAAGAALGAGRDYARAQMGARPFTTAGVAGAAGLAAGGAAGGAAGFGMGAWTGHQAAAVQQAMLQGAAQEQGQASPSDASLDAMKEASLNQAAQMGQAFALRQLGLA